MGYKFQFVNLAGFHSLNLGMFDLARDFRETGMAAYVRLQQSEFDLAESYGYEAVSHQRFVGRGYFDDVAQTIAGGASPTTVLNGSADQTQFSSPSSRLRPQEPRSSTRKRRTMPISGGDGYKDNEGIN